jgi:surface polysaccharide O-acyltransferase-like enzyme
VQTVILQCGSLWTAVEHTWSSIVVDQHLEHFWFLDQLLVYSTVYVVWRLVTARRSSTEPLPVPSNGAIFAFALALALVTFLVMIEYPLNRWTVLFGIFTAEPAHLPEYASLFVVGLLAYQGQWITRMSTRQGMLWLGVGLALSALSCLRPFGATGGFTVDTLMRSTWEAFECVGLCVGLLVLFREVAPSLPRLLQMMAPSAYGVYIIHVYLVVPLQSAVIGLAVTPLVKFVLVVLLAVPISFVLAALLRRVPGLRTVL